MSKRQKADSGALVYGAAPRAHLMPPEVSLRRRESSRRRSLVALLAVVVVATIGGIVAASLVAADADRRLQAERAVTEQLLTGQLEYAEVTTIRADLEAIASLRTQLGATEVLWAEVLGPYLDVVGDETQVSTLTVTSNVPGSPALGVTGPLRETRVAFISLTIITAEVPSPWTWIRAWERLETYADASIDRVAVSSEGYETAVTINLNAEAISLRFGDPAAETSDENTEEGE